MKVRLAALIGVGAVVSLGCGAPEQAEVLGHSQAGLHRAEASPTSISYSVALTGKFITKDGPSIVVSPVFRAPDGSCALGTGPIGSPGYLAGMMADFGRCDDMCPGGVDGVRATEDGQGGCKLQCDCKGDGLGYLDAPAVIQGPMGP